MSHPNTHLEASLKAGDTVCMAGGGTGGHLFPALSIADELRARQPLLNIVFVGTARGIEARVLPKRGEKLETLAIRPLLGMTTWAKLRALMSIPLAFLQACYVIIKHRPKLIVGVGGYASMPLLLAGICMFRRCAIMEQNAHMGVTNRLLARFVGRGYIGFESLKTYFKAGAARVFGNPVRQEMVQAGRQGRQHNELHHTEMLKREDSVFVFGGSQGARTLNTHFPEAWRMCLAKHPHLRRLRICHQIGRNDDLESIRKAYAVDDGVGARIDLSVFIEDMVEEYQRAQVVVCRAGATTVAELLALAKPAILIPFPFAAENHQVRNAQALVHEGAACMIEEAELSAQQLADTLAGLLLDSSARLQMRQASMSLAKIDATENIVDDLMAWLASA